ncbi:tRNA threonylcarbamoyl adenosine modification protein, Sua5/YciO/YrdC/YwlC family [Fontimonas thermophila]|uniref:tRNA threonylcarbamoyl adenosine modification protein, Sua5/YciO/YrdC/YwlC family n=1 Tax=Fontimonas thermophila TaxID=1076937 RepID=A0A1I2HXS8_9GAMM|nr:L-threonylcarbamoyladenylate synthase [Fontimonas thermophila]SFF34263.1 tRNA threonylcarbamoyl adenosine modification protein, Sua5/YciO/YrdC/YwlC family [Fontimonas thermophila]
MADWFDIHPVNPQKRLLARVAVRLRQGAVIAYPTDSCYALGCQLDDREAADRLRRIRGFDRHHHFTLVCRDLSEIATYARVDNRQFRLLKTLTPGPYTFVLQATKELPRRIAHDKRKTVGIRVPRHAIAQALLETLGEPLISCTLQFPGDPEPVGDPHAYRENLDRAVDIVIDGGPCGTDPTTVLDISGEGIEILRRGKGDLARLGL